MTRVGLQIEPQYGFAFDEVVQLARRAEQFGYHALWTSDHLLWDDRATHRPCLEAWTLLTALAPLTTTLRLGTLVTCYAYRPPSLLAKVVACLDTMSHGRVDCGIGAGWKDREFRAYGLPFPAVGRRMAQLREAVHILKQLWTQERVDFRGRYYTLEDALCAPKPLQQPMPLWIGGEGERTLLRLVAEEATGWNMVAGRSITEIHHKLEVLERHCDAVGRDIATLDKSLFVFTFICESEQAFRQLQDDQARKLGPESVAALEQARRLGLGGSRAQVIDTLSQARALGFDYVIALFPYTHEPLLLQRYAAEIWPSLG